MPACLPCSCPPNCQAQRDTAAFRKGHNTQLASKQRTIAPQHTRPHTGDRSRFIAAAAAQQSDRAAQLPSLKELLDGVDALVQQPAAVHSDLAARLGKQYGNTVQGMLRTRRHMTPSISLGVAIPHEGCNVTQSLVCAPLRFCSAHSRTHTAHTCCDFGYNNTFANS